MLQYMTNRSRQLSMLLGMVLGFVLTGGSRLARLGADPMTAIKRNMPRDVNPRAQAASPIDLTSHLSHLAKFSPGES